MPLVLMNKLVALKSISYWLFIKTDSMFRLCSAVVHYISTLFHHLIVIALYIEKHTFLFIVKMNDLSFGLRGTYAISWNYVQ